MTRVDFYVVESGQTRDRLACNLAHKAWRNQHHIYVQVDSVTRSAEVDELLWTFRDISFLPHEVTGSPADPEVRVFIGHEDPPPEYDDVMINLCNEVPSSFSQFQRVVEIVDADPDVRAQARQRYGFYRERGYELKTHKVG